MYVLDALEVVSSIPENSKFKVISSHDPDYTLYEVHTFCELLIKGNPKVIEPLFQTKLCYFDENSRWSELIENKMKFINANVIKQYISFAKSQLFDSSKGKGTATKKYYHAFRLLLETKRMLNFEGPKVWMDGDDREYLMSIRHNQIDSSILDQEMEENFKFVKEKLQNVELVDKLNKDKTEDDLKVFLNNWLINIRSDTVSLDLKENRLQANISHPYYNLALNELKKHNIEGDIICCCVSGSDLHFNRTELILDDENHLIDFIAVYAAPTSYCMGLYPIIPRISSGSPNIRDTNTRGIAIHEVSNICNLIQQGNHRIMEILFSDREDDFVTDIWRSLKEKRDLFVTQAVTNHYQGVGRGQLVSTVDKKKVTGLLKKQLHHIGISPDDIKDTKENRIKLYHALKLLQFGCIIVNEKVIPTKINNDENFSVLQGVLNGSSTIVDIVNLSNSFIEQIEDKKLQLEEVSRRVDERYSKILENWLLLVRRNRW